MKKNTFRLENARTSTTDREHRRKRTDCSRCEQVGEEKKRSELKRRSSKCLVPVTAAATGEECACAHSTRPRPPASGSATLLHNEEFVVYSSMQKEKRKDEAEACVQKRT